MAVVGSRAASAGGRDHTRHFAASLANAGLGIVSGMAAGVDAIAHEAALARADGITVAVVGTGPDVAYPVQHHSLRDRIAARGAVVSEYLPGTCAVAAHFPARNRIIAGLALGTLVVEAAMRSGALITARLAAEAGREVFAVPGSLHNPLARGCHHLIRQGATLVQEPAQLVEGLRLLSGELADALRQRLTAPTELARTVPQPTPRRCDPDYQRLWHALGHDPTPMDSLLERTGLTAAALSSMLLIMELEETWSPSTVAIPAIPSFFTSTASRDAGRGAMKESILDVLLYLFEHYFSEDADLVRDRDSLQNGLIQAGFSPAEISKAFDWLDALAEQRPSVARPHVDGPVRIYHGPELDKLDVDCRGFLLFLEQHRILDADQRELVLDRAMALDQDELDLDDLKWVVLMVLFNQPGAEAAYAWMETQMFLDEPEPVH